MVPSGSGISDEDPPEAAFSRLVPATPGLTAMSKRRARAPFRQQGKPGFRNRKTRAN